MAKGIANGFPLSGFVSRKELTDMQVIDFSLCFVFNFISFICSPQAPWVGPTLGMLYLVQQLLRHRLDMSVDCRMIYNIYFFRVLERDES